MLPSSKNVVLRADDLVSLTYTGEFGFELTTLLPYAYHLYESGRLNSTVGCGKMHPFYYFSPQHNDLEECHRKYTDSKVLTHQHGFPLWWGNWDSAEWARWRPPPLRSEYQNRPLPAGWPQALSWESLALRPLVMIHNKHTFEWAGKPLNTIELPCLERLFSILTAHFTVVYSRLEMNATQGGDNQASWPFEDYKLIKEWTPVHANASRPILVQDLPGDLNLVQLLVNSRATRFISVQGGSMVLPTYFGGAHIIMHKGGFELTNNAYESAFPRLGGAFITTVFTCDELEERVNDVFVKTHVAMSSHKEYLLENRRFTEY